MSFGGGGGNRGPSGQITDPDAYAMRLMREQMAMQAKLQREQEARMRENARLERIENERLQQEAAARRAGVIAEERRRETATFLEQTAQAKVDKGEITLGEAGLNLDMPVIERPAYEKEIRPL
jgi:hypothetical protein